MDNEMWIPRSLLDDEIEHHKATKQKLDRLIALLIPPEAEDKPYRGGPIYGAPSPGPEDVIKNLKEANTRLQAFLKDNHQPTETPPRGHIVSFCPHDNKPCPPSDKCASCANWRIKEPGKCPQK